MTKSKIALIIVAGLGVVGLLGVNGYVLWKLGQIPSSTSTPTATQTTPVPAAPGSMNANMTVAERKAQNQNGPWSSDLIITSASSISSLAASSTTFVEEAGVPTLAKTSDGTLYAVFQWFPDAEESFDKVATSISRDNGVTWSEPETIVFEGMPSTLQRAFDPTLVVLADDTLRLYFTTGERAKQEMRIASATSTDGVHFAYTGDAFVKAGTRLYDCAVVQIGDHWLMTTPHGPNVGAYRATSTDGIAFTETEEIVSKAGENWTGNFLDDSGSLYFFGTASRTGMWYATSTDGDEWSTPISTGFDGGDPAVIKTDGGEYLMIYTAVGVRNQ